MTILYQIEAGQPKQLAASGVAVTGPGSLMMIWVSTFGASSRLAFCDAVASVASAGAGRFVAPFVPVLGWSRLGMFFKTGLYVSMSGSAQQVTVITGPAT